MLAAQLIIRITTLDLVQKLFHSHLSWQQSQTRDIYRILWFQLESFSLKYKMIISHPKFQAKKNILVCAYLQNFSFLDVQMISRCRQLRNKVELFHARLQQTCDIWLHGDRTAKHLNAEGSPRHFTADTGWGHSATTERLWMMLLRDVLSCPLGGFLSLLAHRRDCLAAEDAAQYRSYTAINVSQHQWWEHAAYPAELL